MCVHGLQGTPVRVVCLSSSAHKMGGLDTQDLHFRNRKYGSWKAYGQSKLCNVLFINELAKRYAVPVLAKQSQHYLTADLRHCQACALWLLPSHSMHLH